MSPRIHKPYLSASELAAQFAVHLNTIYRWVRHGCPYMRGGGTRSWLRFKLVEVEEWMRLQGKEQI